MKTYWGIEVQLHELLTSALNGGEWSALGVGHRIVGNDCKRKLENT